MTKKKIIGTLLASACGLIAVAVGTPALLNAMATSSYGDAFVYEQTTPIKYKAAYCQPSVSSEKGMLFYAYDSGAKAEFKGAVSGVFETNLATLAEDGKAPDLAEYSLLSE